MSVQGSFQEYLGIGIEKLPSSQGGGFNLHQSVLIVKFLATTGMTDFNGKTTPTSSENPLGTNYNVNTTRFQSKWSYVLVVSIIIYLKSNSGPDIQFTVHQCARFTHKYKAHTNILSSIFSVISRKIVKMG